MEVSRPEAELGTRGGYLRRLSAKGASFTPVLWGVAANATLLWTWFYLSGATGPVGEGPRRWIAAVCIATLGLVAFFRDRVGTQSARRRCLPIVGTLTVLAMLTWCVLAGHPTVARLAFAASVLWAWRDSDIGWTLVGTSVFALASEHVPALGLPLESIAAVFTTAVGGGSHPVGPTPLAVGPFLTTLLLVLLSTFGRRRVLLGASALFLLVALELRHAVDFLREPANTSQAAMAAIERLPYTCFLFAILGGWVATSGGSGGRSWISPWRVVRRWHWVALAIAMVYASLSTAGSLATPKQGARVLFLNQGGLDWERPRKGKYGAFDGGMFGLLPLYLKADGFRTAALPAGEVTAAALEDVDVFVLINLDKKWNERERDAVRDFLYRGGSVLALGDHTDVFGLQIGFNSLLNEYGMEFWFDSAYPMRPGFVGASRVPRHPVATTARPGFELNHAIGATVGHTSRAIPLVSAPYAFSDHGLRENVMGSFLGNYAYGPRERLGDLSLVAWRDVGKGRIIAYGDTSAFQNGSQREFGQHVLPLFRWLARPALATERVGGRTVLCLLLLGLLVVLWAGRDRGRGRTAYAVALPLLLFVGDGLAKSLAPDARIDGKTVLIDRSHEPWVGHYGAKMNSISPLSSHIARQGLRALNLHDLERGTESLARAIVFVAPTQTFSGSDVDKLMEYQERGGIVIVTAGGEERDAAKPLMHAVGIDLALTPLGKVPRSSEKNRRRLPRLQDAWPIVKTSDDVELVPVFQFAGHVVVGFVPHGKGGLILIADSRFWSTQNVESMNGHWPGNARFIDKLFVRYLHGSPQDVKEVFPSPEKPR